MGLAGLVRLGLRGRFCCSSRSAVSTVLLLQLLCWFKCSAVSVSDCGWLVRIHVGWLLQPVALCDSTLTNMRYDASTCWLAGSACCTTQTHGDMVVGCFSPLLCAISKKKHILVSMRHVKLFADITLRKSINANHLTNSQFRRCGGELGCFSLAVYSSSNLSFRTGSNFPRLVLTRIP